MRPSMHPRCSGKVLRPSPSPCRSDGGELKESLTWLHTARRVHTLPHMSSHHPGKLLRHLPTGFVEARRWMHRRGPLLHRIRGHGRSHRMLEEHSRPSTVLLPLYKYMNWSNCGGTLAKTPSSCRLAVSRASSSGWSLPLPTQLIVGLHNYVEIIQRRTELNAEQTSHLCH